MDKKLTIQFVANTRLKSKSLEWAGATRQAYPLYVIVIYDGANTQFKAEIEGETILVTEDMAQVQTPKMKKKLQAYEVFIEKIVKAEVNLEGENFSLSGLGNRVKIYTSNVRDIFAQRSIDQMFRLIRIYKSKYEGKCTESEILMRFIEIFDRLRELSAYSWIFEADDLRFIDELESPSTPYQDTTIFVMINDELYRLLRKNS